MNSNSLFQDSVGDSRLKQLFAWVTSIYDSLPAGFSSVWVPFFFFFLYSLLELLQLKLKQQLLAMQALAHWHSRSKSFTYNEIKACKCDHKHQNHCTVHYEIDLEKNGWEVKVFRRQAAQACRTGGWTNKAAMKRTLHFVGTIWNHLYVNRSQYFENSNKIFMYEKIAFKNLVSSKKSWKSGVAEDSSRSDLFNKINLPRHKMLLRENFKIVRKFPRKWKLNNEESSE